MNADLIMHYLRTYGSIAIFIIVLLEYMNLPGFPAGVIMPLAGVWAAKGEMNFFIALAITVAAGLTGSMILYWLGRFGGELFLTKYFTHFPNQRKVIEDKMEFLRQKGSVGIFISKLLPMVRTLISIPAGIIHMNLRKYIISSTLGIIVWNFIFVGAGYFLSDMVMKMIA